MAKKLFSYPMDNDDEALGLKSLLQDQNIDFYETPGNKWTYTRACIWIRNDEQFSIADAILQKHMRQYATQAREKYQAETGYDPNANIEKRFLYFLHHLYRKKALIPVLILVVLILYLYFKLFFSLFA